jgi:hypothetical protein
LNLVDKLFDLTHKIQMLNKDKYDNIRRQG